MTPVDATYDGYEFLQLERRGPVGWLLNDRPEQLNAMNSGMRDEFGRAWLELDVPQCGYCQTGMIMAAAALLEQKPSPTDADIDSEITNICRCGTYQRIHAAIKEAAAVASAPPIAVNPAPLAVPAPKA